ncbi:riboflavin biosynthesis pyrimidine reductase [Microbacterium sp. SORGH_AS 505]|uniref:dihydrofolate reductase family protein n=1 Tax=Microbacterium sp. SORGH_AS_0505 TaxID=3041770 RepID=UPI00277ED0EE|nr:dihydrofolate reductase family protein [Microbacterium sp. SORGH_AS_0505]MDQ1127270.1 riboflavin biosynthesis pyrimidine reductase [Microbacterium sp. SORGH_AS_0505]
MWLTEVLPTAGERVDAATPEGRRWIADRYAPPREDWVRLNMITSLTGSAVGPDGTSNTLTNRADRAILGVIRASADAIIVGAQTVRAEGYLLPRRSRLAIITGSGDLAGHRLDPDPDGPDDQVLFVMPEGADAPPVERGITVVHVPTHGGRMPATGILSALTERGLRHIVCEGGPMLAAQFAADDLIDEYCVTAAPHLVPTAGPFLPLRRPIDTSPAGVLIDDDGFSYLRLRRR